MLRCALQERNKKRTTAPIAFEGARHCKNLTCRTCYLCDINGIIFVQADHTRKEYLQFRTSTCHGYYEKFCGRCGFGFWDSHDFDEHINAKECDINMEALMEVCIQGLIISDFSQYMAKSRSFLTNIA